MNKIREEMDDFIAFKSNGASGGNASEEVIAVLTKGTIHKACGQFSYPLPSLWTILHNKAYIHTLS